MKIEIDKSIYILILLLLYLRLFSIKRDNRDYLFQIKTKNDTKKRIGIIAYHNDNNIGNQLLKYSMNVFLKRYGFNTTLISLNEIKNVNIDFLKKYLNIKEIKNYYTDLNESDFDYLIVNSDQVWAANYKRILEVGFLSFAKNWNITKIVYGASLAYDHWISNKKVIDFAKILIKNFSAVSVREQNAIDIIYYYLGIRPCFVLDPTMLIDKNDYLDIIKKFKTDMNPHKNYLCSYILDKSNLTEAFIKKMSNKLKYEIISIKLGVKNFIEKFIFSINICKLIITDSYHGTVFSIIFKKPFITFINDKRGNERFFSLKQTLHLDDDRFLYVTNLKKIKLDILKKIPNINKTNFNILKKKSVDFLKNNLGLTLAK